MDDAVTAYASYKFVPITIATIVCGCTKFYRKYSYLLIPSQIAQTVHILHLYNTENFGELFKSIRNFKSIQPKLNYHHIKL